MAIVLLSGAVQGMLGFGLAVVAMALLPYWLADIRLAVIVLTLSVPIPMAFSFWGYRREVRWHGMRDCLLGAAAGLPVGLIAFEQMGAGLLTGATGLLITAICVGEFRGRKRAVETRPWSRGWGCTAGSVSGMLAGAVGMPGPPVVAYIARLGWTPRELKAFSLCFFTILATVRCTSVVARGYVDARVLTLCAIALPAVGVGHHLGTRIFDRIDPARFRHLVFGLLAIIGTTMTVNGARSVFGTPVGSSKTGRVVSAKPTASEAGIELDAPSESAPTSGGNPTVSTRFDTPSGDRSVP